MAWQLEHWGAERWASSVWRNVAFDPAVLGSGGTPGGGGGM